MATYNPVDWLASGFDTVSDWISTGLSDLFGLGSTNSSRRYNNEVMELQQKFNRENLASQHAYDLENMAYGFSFANRMFNQQNAYNTPEAQVKRLEEAGINPNVLFGGSNPVVSASAPSVPSASAGLPSAPSGMNIPIQSISSGARDLLRLSNETKRNDGELSVLAKTLEGMEIDNLTKAEYLDILKKTGLEKANKEIELLIVKAAEADATAKKMLAEKDLIGYQQKSEEANKALLDAKSKVEGKQAELLQIEINNRDALIKSTIKSNQGSAAAAFSQAALNSEQKEQLYLMRDDILHIKKLERNKEQLDFNLLYNTFDDQLKVLKTQALLSDVDYEEAKQQLDLLKKQNATTHEWMIYSDWILGNLERINDGVNKWAPWALSRTDSERTVTTDFDQYGTATGSHSRIFTHDSSYKPRWKH